MRAPNSSCFLQRKWSDSPFSSNSLPPKQFLSKVALSDHMPLEQLIHCCGRRAHPSRRALLRLALHVREQCNSDREHHAKTHHYRVPLSPLRARSPTTFRTAGRNVSYQRHQSELATLSATHVFCRTHDRVRIRRTKSQTAVVPPFKMCSRSLKHLQRRAQIPYAGSPAGDHYAPVPLLTLRIERVHRVGTKSVYLPHTCWLLHTVTHSLTAAYDEPGTASCGVGRLLYAHRNSAVGYSTSSFIIAHA